MATPAERIYEAATAALGAQQETVTRITGTVAPVGTAAAATALLIKPALVKVDQAGALQVAGLILGAIGALFVLTAALAVLRGVEIERVDPANLLAATRTDVSMLADSQRFHLEVAETLVKTKTENDQALKQLQADFVSMKEGWLSSGGLWFGSSSFRGCWCWSDAHVSMASSLGGPGEIGCSLGRKSEKGGQAARRKAAPRGANFSLRESMCQIAWESLRAMSTWATLAPRCFPSLRLVRW